MQESDPHAQHRSNVCSSPSSTSPPMRSGHESQSEDELHRATDDPEDEGAELRESN